MSPHTDPDPFSHYRADGTATAATVTMMGLLDTCSPEQRSNMVLDFDDPRRVDWDIIPRPDRTGLSLDRFDRHQTVLLWDLIRRTVPLRTFTKILAVPQLEHVLRDYEHEFLGPALQSWRSSESYHLTVFGRPAFEDTWTMRLLGHHVCLNVTVVAERYVCATPMALGQQPTEYDGVLTPLADDEGLGFAVLESLDDAQRAAAVVHDVAPADFVTRQVPAVGAYEYPDLYDLGMPGYVITDADRVALKFVRAHPAGICGAQLGPDQWDVLVDLVSCYLQRLPKEVGAAATRRLLERGPAGVHFAWAGAQRRGAPHYFRVQTEDHLIEAVNAVGGGNHLHTVLRDLSNDFGAGLLAAARTDDRWGGAHLETRRTSSADSDPGLE